MTIKEFKTEELIEELIKRGAELEVLGRVLVLEDVE